MLELFPVTFSWLIPVLPLLAAFLVLVLGAKVFKGKSHWPIWAGVGGAAVLSLWLLGGMISKSAGLAGHEGGWVRETYTGFGGENPFTLWANPRFFTWIEAGSFKVDAGFWIDPLTAVMLAVVTGIGFLIMVFSAGYMKGERGYWRFFASLGLFIFAMTTLVLADNLVLLFLGWEGVGLASYLLIGFYSDKPEAREAAKKAFIVNRIGDLGMVVGICLIFMLFGTVSFFGTEAAPGFLRQCWNPAVVNSFVGWKLGAYYAIPFLILLGCFGKSAQWPLFTWLPDAMAGPTPVSALIHAATMVTAGVYLVVRCGPMMYSAPLTFHGVPVVGVLPGVLPVLGVVAAFTSVLTATIAMRQTDLKKVFAYSTVSQLGFMFVGAAAMAPVAAIFHLVTHAFFKALLFLGSGVVMHATGGELDLRKMSGLKRILPVTRWVMLIGCCALAGIPGFSGFFSKDEIVGGAFAHSPLLGGIMLGCAALTAYYTFRLYFRVFEGEEIVPGEGAARWSAGMEPFGENSKSEIRNPKEAQNSNGGNEENEEGHGHDSAHGHGHAVGHSREPLLLILPLVLLAIGALGAGFLNFPERNSWSLGSFLGQSPSLVWGYEGARVALAKADLVAGGAGVAGELDRVSFGMENPKGQELLPVGLPHMAVFAISGGIAVAGLLLAWWFHLANRRAVAASNGTSLAKVLEGKYWLDEIYGWVVVSPLWCVSKVMDWLDYWVVNGVAWIAGMSPKAGGYLVQRTTQRGFVQGYAVAMLVGVAVVLVLIFG